MMRKVSNKFVVVLIHSVLGTHAIIGDNKFEALEGHLHIAGIWLWWQVVFIVGRAVIGLAILLILRLLLLGVGVNFWNLREIGDN